MRTLYDNPFSPFARKVRMVLRYKGLEFESVDALAVAERPRLRAVHPRAEVPVLVDGELTVQNSADIVAYLDHRYSERPVLPADPALRVQARAWERLADGVLDAIVHGVSLWSWPTHRRADAPPPGLKEAAAKDVSRLAERAEGDLVSQRYLCGELSIGDLALFPHVHALKGLGLLPDAARIPRLLEWFKVLRGRPEVARDVDHIRESLAEKFGEGRSPYEGEAVVWRGDRLEWLFARGFHDWWARELAEGRAVLPEPVGGAGA